MLLEDLRVIVKEPMTLFYDNKAAISIANDPIEIIGLNILNLTDTSQKNSWLMVLYVCRMSNQKIKLQIY